MGCLAIAGGGLCCKSRNDHQPFESSFAPSAIHCRIVATCRVSSGAPDFGMRGRSPLIIWSTLLFATAAAVINGSAARALWQP